MKKILGIGNALVDVMTMIPDDSVLDRYTLPKGSMQLVDGARSASIKEGTAGFPTTLAPGGSAANTIYGVAMLGTPAGFIGSIGKDATGDFFENDFSEGGVKTCLYRRDTPTGTAVALVSKDSERTFATHLGAAVELGADDLKESLFEGFDILYLEGYLIYNIEMTRKACQLAKKAGMKVAIDMASYNVVADKIGDFREIVGGYADIVFANAEEAREYTGEGPEGALKVLSEQCEIAVVKTGAEGSLVKRGDEIVKVGILPVKCVDTTGAGDLYAAGFLYGLAAGKPLDKCGLFGATLAGSVIETIGARMSADKWKEIRKAISAISNE